MTVPHYLTDNARPGSFLVIDENNRPVYQGDVQVPFTVYIPRSCLDGRHASPCPIVNYGHGLFSSRAEVRGADRTGRGWGRVGRGWDVDGVGRGWGAPCGWGQAGRGWGGTWMGRAARATLASGLSQGRWGRAADKQMIGRDSGRRD